MKLREGGDSFDRLFLAIANSQLGRQPEAENWFDRATDYIDAKNWQLNRDFTPLDLLRFRSQAEALLGKEGQTSVPQSGGSPDANMEPSNDH